MKKLELLAPCGNMDCAYAAVQNGADAVYFGGGKFSARANAKNFENDEIRELIKYCHLYNVKAYAAVNTLLKDKEINEAAEYSNFLYNEGCDGLIIQDVGLADLLIKKYPQIKIHASTQMTVHNLEAALKLQNVGFERIVLSRELNISEIKNISEKLKIETEVFVHGALCVCYSGQCLMSSILGGRSGNRGRCAQPCRLPYKLVDENNKVYNSSYLLSPKDICTFKSIKEIIGSGALSLKIEGRMKKPEYVAAVVSSYRKAIDAVLNNTPMSLDIEKEEYLKLYRAFNRDGFSNGYFFGNSGYDMMAYSKNSDDGRDNKDDGFKAEMLKSYKDLYTKKIPLKLEVTFKVNKNILLKTKYKDREFIYKGEIVEKSVNRPVKKEELYERLKKTMDTPFVFSDINICEYEYGFLPVSEINSARRNLIDQIADYVLLDSNKGLNNKSLSAKKYDDENCMQNYNIPSEIIAVTTKEQYEAAKLCEFDNIAINIYESRKDTEYFKNVLLNETHYIRIPEIIKDEFNNIVCFINDNINNIKGIITCNLGIISVFKNKINIIGDYKLNIFNKQSINFYKNCINSLCASVELNKSELKELLKKSSIPLQILIYGKIELMVSEYCIKGSILGGKSEKKSCNRPCNSDKKYYLLDRYNKKFLILSDSFCRMHLYNSYPLNLLQYEAEIINMGAKTLRLDFIDEGYEETLNILKSFKNKIYDYDSAMYTKGHYRRGVD